MQEYEENEMQELDIPIIISKESSINRLHELHPTLNTLRK